MPGQPRSTLRDRLLAVPRALRPSTPAQFIVFAFTVLVVAGTAVLMIPVARDGQGGAALPDAFFTAVSAVTVTGLTVVDTATHWTPLGQVTILVLVQVGGLGIMISASLLGLMTLRRFGLSTRISAVAETRSIGAGVGVADVTAVLRGVVMISVTIEAATAALLALRFATGYDEPLGRAVWLGVFHAVSAFNCAGFALYSDSLARFAGDPGILVPIGVAVLLGGLGFPVLLELLRELRQPSRWSLNTWLVLSASAWLLPLGAVAITALEWNNPRTLGSLGPVATVLEGTFEAIVPRSAGFSTIDPADLDPSTWLVLDVLMFLGAGPAGTAGGIKLTTASVLFFMIYAEARGESEVNAFGRRIPRDVQRQAVAVALLATGVVVFASMAITVIADTTLDRTVFEVVSAFSTTGLSVGLTTELPVAGQAILVALMLVGRLGPVTLATALALRRRSRLYQLPQERPIIG